MNESIHAAATVTKKFLLFIVNVNENINGNFLYTGAEGLEPPNNGAKNRRLTTWLCPKLQYIMKGGDKKVNVFPKSHWKPSLYS